MTIKYHEERVRVGGLMFLPPKVPAKPLVRHLALSQTSPNFASSTPTPVTPTRILPPASAETIGNEFDFTRQYESVFDVDAQNTIIRYHNGATRVFYYESDSLGMALTSPDPSSRRTKHLLSTTQS